MSSNLKVNTILPSTGTTIGIGTVGGLINIVGNIDVNSTSGISTFNGLEISGIVTAKAGAAVTYYGDGSNLTGIDLGAVTGATGDFSIADKIVHTGDTNTAIRFPAADKITLETSGTERFQVDSSGNIYVGGVGGSATAGTLWFNDTSANASKIAQSNGNSALTFHTGSSQPERLRIDSGGRILKGLTTARGNYGNNASGVEYGFQIEGTSAIAAGLSIVRNSNDANDGGIVLGKTRATSNGGNTVVQAGDDLGNLTFAGNDGSTMLFGAEIFAEVQSGVGNDDMPADLIFKTNGGSTSTTERLRIHSGGDVEIADGNLKVANGHGIDFSATPANAGRTTTQELLDDYEEGTFTASMQGGSNSGSFSGSQQSRYVKIGKQVTCWIMIHGDLSGASGNLEWTGFPFTSENPQEAVGALQFNNMRGGMPSGTNTVFALMHPGLTRVHFRCNADGNNTAYTALSSSTNYGFTYARLVITYTTAS